MMRITEIYPPEIPCQIPQIYKSQSIAVTEQQQSEENTKEKRVFTDLENISLTFQREKDFSYIGSESNLSDLDVKKVVSDMRKDKIFEEYQYFVGGKPDLEYDGDIDGTFIIKGN